MALGKQSFGYCARHRSDVILQVKLNLESSVGVISGAQTAYISAFYRYYLTLHRRLDNKWAL
jgi:hypothetical protein